MTDEDRLDLIAKLAADNHRSLFKDEPMGFLVTDDGDVLSGLRSAGYRHPTLRKAIDALAKAIQRKKRRTE